MGRGTLDRDDKSITAPRVFSLSVSRRNAGRCSVRSVIRPPIDRLVSDKERLGGEKRQKRAMVRAPGWREQVSLEPDQRPADSIVPEPERFFLSRLSSSRLAP